MKFITQGETPIINTNDNLEIVETDTHGSKLITLPTTTAAPLPIIWLTDDVSTETITAMIATEQYTICIYTDIEKDAANVPGYQKPLVLGDKIFLSIPGIDDKHLLTDEDNPNDIEIPVEFLIARNFCHEIFTYSPLKESQEYDLHLHALGINSLPYKPSSPTPSPIPIPAPIINIPVPLSKGKAKAIKAEKPTLPSSPKKKFGDTCPKCRRPYKYDHVAWAQGQTDGYTCRCKKNLAPPPSPSPLVPLSPHPHTLSPKTTASEQANPTTTQPPTQCSFPYVNYDQFDQWV